MSAQLDKLDAEKRALEIQESRDRDAARLNSGVVHYAELRRINSFVHALPLRRYRMIAIGGVAIPRG